MCGGLAVYVLGSRSFCQYGCPYGMVFTLPDRSTPGKLSSREIVPNAANARRCVRPTYRSCTK
ncbi:MAG: hypothetical protein IPP86_02475 [Bacteroidetes bacterium]|nr:hypothetical protein [Bacteroidota bacterium]